MQNKLINKPLINRGFSIIFILLFAIQIFFAPWHIIAADSGRAFTITPPVFELKVNPGDSLSEVVTVFNNGNEDLAMATSIENLRPMGEKGQVQVIGESEQGLPSLRDWIKIKDKNFTLEKGATRNVTFDVNVPSNAEPGGHFVTILFGTTGTKPDGTGAQLSQKIGTLVFVTVAGQAKEQALITNFFSDKKLYLKNGTINYNLKIANQGNVYIRPKGFLVVTDIFGRKVKEIEIDSKNILPDAIREIPLQFKSEKFFGPYTSTLTLVYGSSNVNLNASNVFWVIPWIPTLLVLVLLILTILLRRRLRKAIRILIGREK